MSRRTTDGLIRQLAEDRQAIALLAAEQRLGPLLELELTAQQLKIVLLVASGVAATGAQLAECLHIGPPTVSASIRRLVEMDYLVQTTDDADRRVRTLVATERAKRLQVALSEQHDASDQLLAALDPQDLAALAQGTGALRRALAQRR